MKCSICGSDTQAEGKLCAHCRAARHRAFAETVTRPHPAALAAAGPGGAESTEGSERAQARAARKLAKRARRVSAAAVLAERNAAGEASELVAANEAWPARYRHAVGVLLAIAIGGVLYVGYRLLVPDRAAEPVFETVVEKTPERMPVATPVPVPQPPPIVQRAAPEPPRGAVAPDASTTRAFAGLTASNAAPVLPAGADSASRPREGSAKTAKSGSTRGRTTIAPPPVPSSEPGPVAVEPVAAAPVVVREAPKPDKWQMMGAALARCGNENIFTRIACEHRVRLQYCEGAWGQVTQCAAAAPNDHGQ